MKKQKTYVAMLLATLVILSLAGCGMKNSKDNAEATTGWSVENPDNTTKDKKTTESTDAEDNIEEDADGIMDNLGAGTFDTYEDAKNYLMDKLTADNEDMSYEFREETQDLTSYDSGNPGAEGYPVSYTHLSFRRNLPQIVTHILQKAFFEHAPERVLDILINYRI